MARWIGRTAFGLAAAAASGLLAAGDPAALQTAAEPPGAAAAGAAAPEEPAAPLALEDALALALVGNPALRASSCETRAGEARALQAGRQPNPQLEIRLQNLDASSGVADESRRRVMINQELELGGKLGRRVALAEAEGRLAQHDREIRRAAVIRDVRAAFAAVLGAQQQAAAWQRFVDLLVQAGSRVGSLVRGGFAGVIEEHRVTRQLGLARIEAQAAQARLGAARFALAATWGRTHPRFTAAQGRLDPPGPLPELQVLLDRAARAPAVARAQAELSREDAALALARAERIPDLELGAGVRWEGDQGPRGYLVDLGIELPVFDRNRGAILEAQQRLAGARARRQAAAADGAAALAEAYFAASEAAGRARTLEQDVVPSARAALEAHRAAFEDQTRGGAGDLIDAGRDLARAEADLARALVEAHQARATIEERLGHPLSGAD